MGNTEEQNLDLLNMEQEDDDLLGISPPNAELLLGASLLSPSILPKALKQESLEDLENGYGKDEVVGAPGAKGADLDLDTTPVPCRSPMAPSSVLCVLNFNEMNKRNINRDIIEDPWSRKGYSVKESIQLDGIAETSPVKHTGNFTSQLSRSYLDIENDQTSVTPVKIGGELTVLRKNRSRRSTTLRKSLAWDKAFFTDEGVLDNDELFAVASATPKTLTMPELATIWDGPQPLIAPFEAKTTPVKTPFKSELRTEARPEVRPEVRTEMRPELRPEVRKEMRPAVHPKQDVSHTSSLRSEVFHTSSIRPVRRIHTSGSHAFSNAYSRAAAIPQGSTSIPLPNSLSRTGKQLAAAAGPPIENPQGTVSDTTEPRNTSTGLYHQARIAALKKAHECPLQKGPRVRQPNSISNKNAEDKHLEEIKKVNHLKKMEDKHLEEVHKLKQPKKVEGKPPEEIRQMHATPKKQPELTRSMSTSALLDSPSALSRKVSFMSKKVKETLGRVMPGRARRVSTEPSLSHVHPVEKASKLSKRASALPTVPEVKDPSHRTKSNAAVVPVKLSKYTYTVRDILRGKGPPSSPREPSKQGPTLMRSKSACAVPGLPRAIDSGLPRVVAPSAPLPPPPPPPPVQPSEPVAKPTGLRKPSPKLGFFDTGRATSAPPKASTTSHLLQAMQPARQGSEASIPIEPSGHRLHGLTPAKLSSAIPSAPHLRHGMVSAPTSPRSIHVMHPSSPNCNSSTTTKPSSPNIGALDLSMSFSGIRHAKQFAESHQLLAKKILRGDVNGSSDTVSEAAALDSFNLQEALSTSAEQNMETTEHMHGGLRRRTAESNLPTLPAVNFGDPEFSGSRPEPGGREPEGNTACCLDLIGLQNFDCSAELGETRTEKHTSLETTCNYLGSNGFDREFSTESNGPMSSSHNHPGNVRSSARKGPNGVTKLTDSHCDSPRSRSFREIYSRAVDSCEHTNDASRDNDLPGSAFPCTPTSKDHCHAFSAKLSRQFDSPRSKSFRETSYKTTTLTESPAAAGKHVRSYSQRIPWQSPGGKIIGDSSPGVGPAAPSSGGKHHSIISPSHVPDAAGTFEVLTPSSSKNARCVRTPGSSAKKVVRKIVEFESPSSQWSNWPVLGAAISEDQLPRSAKAEGLSPVQPRPSREQATENSTESRPSISASLPRTTSSESKDAELDRASGEQCLIATEQSAHSRLSLSNGFVSTPSNALSVEMGSGSMHRNPLLEFNGADVCPSTPASAKKEKGSSMLSFARKAVARLTSSPAPAEPFAQENEGTPRSSRKTSRRFSRSGSSTNCPLPEPKLLSPFSEARICELEAAGPEILEKKSGPVQNSPPDKIAPESNPWSPVRKNGQPLGPFDCTKLKYISPGLTSS